MKTVFKATLIGAGMGLLLSACGESTSLTAVAPSNLDETVSTVSLVTGNIINQKETATNFFGTGTSTVEISYPAHASPGEEVTVATRITFNSPRRAFFVTQVTGQGFEIDPVFLSGTSGCPIVPFFTCTITETFTVPAEAAVNTEYEFSATIFPRNGFSFSQTPLRFLFPERLILFLPLFLRKALLVTTFAF
ncbi:MAG: hypothetical protein HC921_14380, partial [Synechococcaceae cyanobacterium SM2_3_1]|nr:hypothetical protein [Synechococcaceae cyanobacterium SM2_3_1]